LLIDRNILKRLKNEPETKIRVKRTNQSWSMLYFVKGSSTFIFLID